MTSPWPVSSSSPSIYFPKRNTPDYLATVEGISAEIYTNLSFRLMGGPLAHIAQSLLQLLTSQEYATLNSPERYAERVGNLVILVTC